MPGEGLQLTDLRLSSTPGIQQFGLPGVDLFFERLQHLKWFRWSQEATFGTEDDEDEGNKTNHSVLGVTAASSGTIPSQLGLLTPLKGLSLGTY